MNYRHGFHAGNFADVLKHVVLVAIVDYLAKKDAPFAVLDTHAGRGGYDLTGGQAGRTREFENGVGRLWQAGGVPPLTARWLQLVRQWNRRLDVHGRLVAYPGSPRLAQLAMRPGDQVMACELQPDECALLRAAFRDDRNVAVHARDGWEALRGLLPPPQKRGLVLIDPPYEEQEDELYKAADAMAEAARRFPGGTFALWYPIKEGAVTRRFLQYLARGPYKRLLVAELCVLDDDNRLQLNGSGMAIANPPYTLHDALAAELPWLWEKLAVDGGGRHFLRWLVDSEA